LNRKTKERQNDDLKNEDKQTIYKTLHRKLTIEQHKPLKSLGWTQMIRNDGQFLFH